MEYLISLYDRYGDSLPKCLSAVYPEFDWKQWKFEKTPQHFFKDNSNVDVYIEWLSRQLDVFCEEDLYHVSTEEIRILGGWQLMVQYGGLSQLLSR
jgi:hypothetical protein